MSTEKKKKKKGNAIGVKYYMHTVVMSLGYVSTFQRKKPLKLLSGHVQAFVGLETYDCDHFLDRSQQVYLCSHHLYH